MPRSYSRTERVADLIQNILADILQKEMNDMQLGLITVTDVKVSPDFSHAKIYVSVLMDENASQAIQELNNNSKHYRYLLANQISLRIVPELKFFYDDSTARGARISSLIHGVLKDHES